MSEEDIDLPLIVSSLPEVGKRTDKEGTPSATLLTGC